MAAAQGCRHRPAGTPGPGRLRPGCRPPTRPRPATSATITTAIAALAPAFPHDADYLELLVTDFGRWADGGFGVPDFLDSLLAFQPQQHRVNGLQHLVVFPMYTQNGSSTASSRPC